VIGLVTVTEAGARAADTLADAWDAGVDAANGSADPVTRSTGAVRRYDGPASEALPRAFAECDGVVAFLATGAAVRLLAPHLGDKTTDPGVVCVDEARRFAVPVLGGHAGGANALAARVADALGATPVVTTASDATGVPGLDTLGWPVEGAVAAVGRAVLDGAPVRLDADATWPLPALPSHVREDASSDAPVLRVTDRVEPAHARTAVLRPPSLVVGVGASRGVGADELLDLVDTALADAGLSPASVRHLATVDAKADEDGIVEAARRRGWGVVTYGAPALALVDVPNPSDAPLRAVGTPSVAEAAARVRTDGGESTLVVEKRASARATVAVARHAPRGRLTLVGLGPGARDLLTPRARDALRAASVVVGLDQYLAQVRDLLRPGTRVLASGLGAEEERARTAVAEARAGHAVALVGSGDAGVYAMASPALEEAGRGAGGGAGLDGRGTADGGDVDVEVVPGVTAALAASALLGAPLGHDHAAVSLSDLHTPWEAIERRVTAVAEGDLAVTLYNPRSRGRDWQLPKALGILAVHRPPDTPVGVVRNASRDGERVVRTTLADLDPDDVDMLSVVVVGSSTTRVVAGRMVTPRGYRWRDA
jgi:cobalt-precorrin 5A hydrolase / precorrin-3B C17-methyltransferase